MECVKTIKDAFEIGKECPDKPIFILELSHKYENVNQLPTNIPENSLVVLKETFTRERYMACFKDGKWKKFLFTCQHIKCPNCGHEWGRP